MHGAYVGGSGTSVLYIGCMMPMWGVGTSVLYIGCMVPMWGVAVRLSYIYRMHGAYVGGTVPISYI